MLNFEKLRFLIVKTGMEID
ncbi:unnamed protein product, partial [Rotaria sordida]